MNIKNTDEQELHNLGASWEKVIHYHIVLQLRFLNVPVLSPAISYMH